MILAAMAGIPNFIGWPDRGPLPIGVSAYTDCISPRFAAAALIAALDYRNKTGKGQMLDISQFETALSFILPALLDYAANRREPERVGNASRDAAPHGVYPCMPGVDARTGKPDNDRWCAVSVSTDEQWNALCKLMNRPDLPEDVRFATLLNRKQHENELDKIVSGWTVTHSAEEIMDQLQAAGVPAGVVKNASDIYSDPQLNERGLFWKLEHPVMGEFTHLGQGFVMSRTPAQALRPSPCLGEHTEHVCTELLGMSDDEFAALASKGVFE
jgi:benzylsuccinate CoA-transferase BbsF subunit